MRAIFLLFVTFAISAASVFADIKPPMTPVPKPVDEMNGRIYVDLRSDVKMPTLKIRREVLQQLRAAIDEADDVQNGAAVARSTSSITRTQTIVSGTLFSLALVFGGIWLFREKARSPRAAVSTVVLAVIGLGAVVVFANSPPPSMVGLTTRIFEKNTKAYGYASGRVKIQILDRQPGVFNGNDRDDVILEIPSGGEGKDSE